ncbi:MAG TPA: hypothetical protein VGI47_04095 [Candidatus Binataceae bacterium]|jgi:hypothetical protein
MEAFVRRHRFTQAKIELIATNQLSNRNQRISKDGRDVIKGGVKVRSVNADQMRQTGSFLQET